MSKAINKKIEELYQRYETGPVHEKGGFSCPVCKKQYKSLNGIESHMSKQDCIDLKAVYTGTQQEFLGFGIFKVLASTFNPSTHVTFTAFSGGNQYNSIMRLLTILNVNGIYQHWEDYLGYVMACYPKVSHTNALLKNANRQSTINDFKVVMHASDMIDDKAFLAREMDNLKSDANYFIRSLEKCKFGVMRLIDNEEVSEIMAKLENEYPEYYLRARDLVTTAMAARKMSEK